MTTFTITKDNKIGMVKAEMKEKITKAIRNALSNEGIGELQNIRIVSNSATGKNTLAVNVGTIVENGFEFDFNYQIDVIFKDYKDKQRSGKTYPAFDMEESVNNYKEWEEKENEKARVKEEEKRKKIEIATKTKTAKKI